MTDTNITAVVNPEDIGTGVSEGDEDFISAGFDMIPEPNTSAIINGLGFTADFGAPSFDLANGVAYVETSGTEVQGGSQTTYDTTVPGNQYQHVIVPSNVTGLSLDDNAVNEIWIAHDRTNQDSAFIRHGSGLSEPAEPSHKLGEIDTTGDTTSEQWGLVAADGTLTYPDATVASNQQSALGSDTVVYDRANGTRIIDGELSATTLEATGSINTADLTNASDGQVLKKAASGTDLAFGTVEQPDVTWLQSDAPTVDVQLAGDESVTIPSGKDWMVSIIQSTGANLLLNGNGFTTNGARVDRVVLESGSTIKTDFKPTFIQGWDVSNVSLTTVTETEPTIPSDETWIGCLLSEGGYEVDGNIALGTSTGGNTGVWTALSDINITDGSFGGFKL